MNWEHVDYIYESGYSFWVNYDCIIYEVLKKGNEIKKRKIMKTNNIANATQIIRQLNIINKL